jgi:hypothetical protein
MPRNKPTVSNYSTKIRVKNPTKTSSASQQTHLSYQSFYLWVSFLWGLMTLGMVGQRVGVEAQGLPTTLDLASLMATQGTVIQGAVAADEAGWSVASAGDVNGDGLNDLLVGAWMASPVGRSNAGAAYLIYGSRTLSAVLDLSALNATQGMAIQGAAANDKAGSSVSSAGDVNGDGIADLLVGAYQASPLGRTQAGAVYLIYGSRVLPAVLDLATLNASQGMVIQGAVAVDRAGISVASSGDVNGDGINDIVVGANLASPVGRSNAGSAYVIYGSRVLTAVLDLNALTLAQGMVIQGAVAGDFAGISVSSAGDVNGDGIADLLVGAWYASPVGRSQAGAATLIYGSRVLSAVLDLNALTPTQGTVIRGAAMNDWAGYSVASAGDVNGDGLSDLLVGAYQASPLGRTQAGAVYLIYGSRTLSTVLDLNALIPAQGTVIRGAAMNDWAGYSVASAGDVNGDGLSDLLVGASGAFPVSRILAGAAYLIYGSRTLSAVLDLNALTATQGIVIQGAVGDIAGSSVASAGDVNGDGLSDLLVGASIASPLSRSIAGAAYLIYGSVVSQVTPALTTTQASTVSPSTSISLSASGLTPHTDSTISPIRITNTRATKPSNTSLPRAESQNIVGPVVGAVVGVAALGASLLGAVGFFVYRKRSRANQSTISGSNNSDTALKNQNSANELDQQNTTAAKQAKYRAVDETKKSAREYDQPTNFTLGGIPSRAATNPKYLADDEAKKAVNEYDQPKELKIEY